MNGLTVLLILLALAVGWWAHAIGKEVMDRLFGIGSADQIVFVPEDWGIKARRGVFDFDQDRHV